MNAVKLREQYQSALAILSELQILPVTSENALSKVFTLAKLSRAIAKSAPCLQDEESNFIWQERLANLQDDMLAVIGRLLQPVGQKEEQFWHRCLSLLYAGVEACEQLEKEKHDILKNLSMEVSSRRGIEESLCNELKAKECALKDNFELRTRMIIQQEELMRHDTHSRNLAQQLVEVRKARDMLSAERNKLAEECFHRTQALERQATAISQLMDGYETSSKERDEALQSFKHISEQAYVLESNLARHAKVIENLIDMNVELMNRVNKGTQDRTPKVVDVENKAEDVNRPSETI